MSHFDLILVHFWTELLEADQTNGMTLHSYNSCINLYRVGVMFLLWCLNVTVFHKKLLDLGVG